MQRSFVTTLVLAVASTANCGLAADHPPGDRRPERLRQLDRNGDGLLSKDEISTQLWERIALHDVDGDEKLDADEQTAAGVRTADGQAAKQPGGAPTSFTVHAFQGTSGQTLRYSLFVPKQSAAESKLPVVLCLHGRGGSTQAALVLGGGKMQSRYPCLIIAPGIDGSKERWAGSASERSRQRSVMPELIELLDAVIREHGGDPNRVYVTGQSMGGVGTWGLIASYPDRIAAAVPVCGVWKPDEAERMKFVPVWAFHGADDATVPASGSRAMIAALKAAGAEPKYTEYPGVGHSSWLQAYATADMWDWMFAQHHEPTP